jgi:DNA sulfur modification protein DndD
MKLDTLSIENFGPYRGQNTIDLRTTAESPVVLFGGKNGAGKTTLFKSVQLCLHGKSALGRRTSAAEYEQEIREELHDLPNGKAETASITLQFEYANFGRKDRYTVMRRWRDRGESIAEEVEIERNGEELSELDEDQWEDFLKELIPPGVSQLFFFDGEKVQQLASAIENDAGFEESLRSLLGLELVERLEADLSIYLSNKLNEEGKPELQSQLADMRESLEEAEQNFEEVEREIEEYQDELGSIERDLAGVEEELAREGGAFAAKHDELKTRRAELESDEERIEERLREQAMGELAFSLVPELCQRVRDRLREEAETLRVEAARTQIAEEVGEIVGEDDAVDLDLDDEQRSALVTDLQAALGERSTDTGEVTLATAFSQQQRERMYTVVEKALTEVPDEMESLTSALESVTRELTETERQIGRVPEEATISPIIDRSNELRERKGKIQARLEDLETEREELERRVSHLETRRDSTIEKTAAVEDISDRAELAKRTRQTVQEYKRRLTERKLDQLEDVLTDRYRRLSNKGEFYQQVEMDPETMEISIQTKTGSEKQVSQLAAGERQIFATAMIWALAEISDRPLPFIIDTPLGRLDEEHRENLVRHFFPEASHQVIILSTDTEITEQHYDYITEETEREYRLDYDREEGFTRVRTGYFGSDNEADAQNPSPSDAQITMEKFNE